MNTPKPRYLTKSRFKLANECPTKLFYTAKKDVYVDKSFDDEFLAALAEGGFQVGELAKAMYPGGHDIKDLDYETSLRKTGGLTPKFVQLATQRLKDGRGDRIRRAAAERSAATCDPPQNSSPRPIAKAPSRLRERGLK